MGLRCERGEVEVAERSDRREAVAERSTRTRVCGEDDRLFDALEALDDPCEPVGPDVRLAVDRREHERPRLEAEPLEDVRPLARERREPHRGVRHHVPDDLDPSRHVLGEERFARALVRRQQQPGEPVDLDPVPLLGHLEVAASQPRLDVRDRGACEDSRAGAREGRVRVAVDEHGIGSLAFRDCKDRGLHRLGIGGVQIEAVARLAESELVEEDLRELRVVVLSGVDDDFVDSTLAQRHRKRCGLDELRTVPDDGEDLHDVATLLSHLGPLAQLVEQGTLNPKVVGSIPTRPTNRV